MYIKKLFGDTRLELGSPAGTGQNRDTRVQNSESRIPRPEARGKEVCRQAEGDRGGWWTQAE